MNQNGTDSRLPNRLKENSSALVPWVMPRTEIPIFNRSTIPCTAVDLPDLMILSTITILPGVTREPCHAEPMMAYPMRCYNETSSALALLRHRAISAFPPLLEVSGYPSPAA